MRKNNTAAFDFPYFDAEPTTFFVCSTPRSGSTFLCRGLWETKHAGAPKEYFNPSHERDFKARWSFDHIEDYIKHLKCYRTSPNGYFGIKTHWNHFELLHSRLKQPIASSFNAPSYIFITRNDKIKQAISWAKAKQTKQWTFDAPQKASPEFDKKLINECLQKIRQQEDAWDHYFSSHQVTPYHVTYENLATQYTETIYQLLQDLGIELQIKDIPSNPLKPQFDQTNQNWLEQYLKEQ